MAALRPAPAPNAPARAHERVRAHEPTRSDAHLLLFNDPRFHAIRRADGYRRLDHHSGGGLVGSLCGVIEGDAFTSGYSAPFGGFDLTRPDHSLPDLADLVDGTLAQLRSEGVNEVRIRCRPSFYSPSEPVLHALLMDRGFTVERCDINQHVHVAGLGDMRGYLERLKPKRSRDVRLDLAGEFSFARARRQTELAQCQAVLDQSRKAKGRPPGLPLDYVTELADSFPGAIRMYALSHRGRPCAAALVYRVLPGRDLLISWGDAGHDLRRSPMNLLAYRLVEEALATGARTLDLGPSSEPDGTPSPGMFQFKRSVLGRPDTRLTLVRTGGE